MRTEVITARRSPPQQSRPRLGWLAAPAELLAWLRPHADPQPGPVAEEGRRPAWLAGLLVPELLAWRRRSPAWPEPVAEDAGRAVWFSGLTHAAVTVVAGPYYFTAAALYVAGASAKERDCLTTQASDTCAAVQR